MSPDNTLLRNANKKIAHSQNPFVSNSHSAKELAYNTIMQSSESLIKCELIRIKKKKINAIKI